ncbi:MAG: hypothetical protein KJP18_06880 [Gemmatimonadetes bacterium]|nr:hypothetical protein [Gemmatimonadota bacterium]
MIRSSRATAVLATIALVFQLSLPAWGAPGTTLEGTVRIPCDPSRLGEVASVLIRPASGGADVISAVDPATGGFSGADMTAGVYELVVIGTDGVPLSPEPTNLAIVEGPNEVVLNLQPPGCGEQGSESAQGKGLKDWHVALIYFGALGALAALLTVDSEEGSASPFEP